MTKIKLTILAILASMYGIALMDGIVRFLSWFAFIGLFITLVSQLEKRYGLD